MFYLECLGKVAAALAVTYLAQLALQPVARRWRLFDFPNARKDHALPTPVTGGLAMLIGVLVVEWSFGGACNPFRGAFTLAAVLLVVVGLLDDKYDLSWWSRICAQTVAALIMVREGGVRIEHLDALLGQQHAALSMLEIPFTLFAIVGLINAINMIDGADGLAGSLVLTALVMLFAVSLYSGNQFVAQLMCIEGGAVMAFLWFNLRLPWRPRAVVFMGNAGSTLLGFMVALAAIRITQTPDHPVSPVLALWLIPVPLVDCLVLMTRRMHMGHSPFKADHNHVHHLLRIVGVTPTRKAFFLSLFSAVCGLLAGQALRMDVPDALLLAAFFLLCTGWYWLTSRRARVVRLLGWITHASIAPDPVDDLELHAGKPKAP